ncbi:MAG: hypothetical protein FWH49_02580 [Clostridiales bacterium]|nr:hypothetical protein [Clostridiales bacterium]
MKKEKQLNTSLLGVAPADMENYLLKQEKKHEDAIAELAGKLKHLEDTIAEQGDDIQNLENLLKRPEMQNAFIDLAERFLVRFGDVMEEAARESAAQKDGAGQNHGEADRLPQVEELRRQIENYRTQINELLQSIDKRYKTKENNNKATDRLKELRFLYLSEKKAAADVVSRSGEVLLGKGEAVTPEVAERVFQLGLMDQLIRQLI